MLLGGNSSCFVYKCVKCMFYGKPYYFKTHFWDQCVTQQEQAYLSIILLDQPESDPSTDFAMSKD